MTAEQSIRNIEHLMDAVNAAARNTPKPDPRADLVDLFEARAETHYDKSWIEVEEAADLVMDRGAEITDAQVEVAAKVIATIDLPNWSWENAAPLNKHEYRAMARAALEAARGVQS